MRCLICGKILLKSPGPIGPTCLRKSKPKTRKLRRERHIKFLARHDIFGD